MECYVLAGQLVSSKVQSQCMHDIANRHIYLSSCLPLKHSISYKSLPMEDVQEVYMNVCTEAQV